VYGLNKKSREAGEELVRYLQMQEQAGNLVLDWDKRSILSPDQKEIGKIDEMVSLMVNQNKVKNPQLNRIKYLIQVGQIPVTLVKNTKMRNNLYDDPIMVSPFASANQSFSTPNQATIRENRWMEEDGEDDGGVGRRRAPTSIFRYT
jgi:hypothetical protein